MQLVDRTCDGCGRAVQKLGDADGCGSCDVVLCRACLQGTDRCPSCQRPFVQTRDQAPRAGGSNASKLSRGRRQARAVAVSLLGSIALVAALGGTSISIALVQVIAIALLVVQLFRGRAWAQWLLVAFSALGAIGNVHAVVARHAGDAWHLSLVLALVYTWTAGMLALSEPVRTFLRAQRLRNV